MAAISYYDLIEITPNDPRPLKERVRSALQKGLPIAAQAGIVGAIGCSVAALFACGTSAEVIVFLSSIGINAFTGDLIAWANKGKQPSADEIDEAIRRIQASGSAEINEFSTALGIVTTTLDVIDDRTLQILTSVEQQRLQSHLLGEDIVSILFKQRAHYDTRFDNLEALLRAALDNRRTQPGFLWLNVPTKRPHFIGRDEVCAEISQLLTSGAQPFVSVDASGGVGKSALATAVVYTDSVRARFADGVLWASLGENPDIARLQKEWADAISFGLSQETDLRKRIQLICNSLASRRILIVLDDVWHKEDADLLTLASPNAAHLLTTRMQSIAQAYAPDAHRHLAYLDEESSFKLLKALAPEACAGHEQKVRAIAAATGGRSITLATIGAYLAAPENSMHADLADVALGEVDNMEQRLSLAARRIGHSGGLRLEDALALSLSDFAPERREAFYALGAFAPLPARFDWEAAKAVAQCDSRAISLFVDRNLVERDKATYPLAELALHQSFSELARLHQPPEAQARHHDHYLALAQAHQGYDQKHRDAIAAALPQIEHAWQATHDYSDALPVFYAAMLWPLHRNNLYTTAGSWAKRVCGQAQRTGNQQLEADALLDQAIVARMVANYAGARWYLDRAYRLHEEVGDRLGMANDRKEQAIVARMEIDCFGTRYLEEAYRLHEEVGSSLGMANDRQEQATVALIEADYASARTYLEEAYRLHQQVGSSLGMASVLAVCGLLEMGEDNKKAACALMNAVAVRYRSIGIAVPLFVQNALIELTRPESTQ